MLLRLEEKNTEALAAVDSNGNNLTYGQLVSFIQLIKTKYTKRKLAFILARNNVGAIAWIVGMIESGIVPLILSYNLDGNLLNELIERYQPNYILSMQNSLDYPTIRLKKISSNFGYNLFESHFPDIKLNPLLSHLLPTSGSTGSPKLVRHSYNNIKAAAHNTSLAFKIEESDRALLVLPLYYTMGLSVVFSHLYSGATILITDLSMTDRRFWEFFRSQRASSFTGVPYSYEILDLMRFFRFEFPSLKLLTQGGGKMPRELNLKFAEWCNQTGRKWIATYGQTEGTARMSYLKPENAISKSGSIGKPIPNGIFYLIDEYGEEIKTPNCEGELCYKGGNVTLGYAFTKENLSLGDERLGTLKTGDFAYRDDDGYYFITGRKGRFLKLFGLRIGLDEVENLVKSNYQAECVCMGDDTKLKVFISSDKSNTLQKEEIVNFIAKKIHLTHSVIIVSFIDKIPKNDTGKILYSQLNNL